MKAFIIIISLFFWNQQYIKAQSLVPSTVRQIFSLEKGDSLEYHIWTESSPCGTICNTFELKVVDSVFYNSGQDTLSILFQTEIMRFDSTGAPENPCGNCRRYFEVPDITYLGSTVWKITKLDSSIVSYMDSVYGPMGSTDDSIYQNTLYNGKKQNSYGFYGYAFSSSNDVYADSIGIVYKAESVELADNNREQLVYYHKANGDIYGTSYINAGINDDYSKPEISVYPNPVYDNFFVVTGLNQTSNFKLFDMLSRKVTEYNLTDRKTEIKSNNLIPGVYYWQINQQGIIIKTGVLIIN